MEHAALFHRPIDQFAYLINSDTLHIRLQTKRDDVSSAQLIYGDPYINENGKWVYHTLDMTSAGKDGLFEYWHAYVKPPHKRIRYGFHLTSQHETTTYTEKGFFDSPPLDCSYYFSIPYLHENLLFRPPEWVKQTIWYQIFPERFANGNPENDPEHAVPWGSEEPKIDNFFGGDFEGVLKHLDYLEDLGITGIYFTPVFKAPSNHKYDTIDYFEIDPHFGTKDTLKQLIQACHERNIRVMLDAVFNHSGYYFRPFQDVLAHGEHSRYKDWFHPNSFPLQGGPRPNYETFGFVESMPKLNTKNPEVKQYLLDVATYWIKEFDIDGWRLDVANEVDHPFWREFRQTVKQMKPDVYILGEIWHDSISWLRGDQFDAVMNYPFTVNALKLVASQTINAKQFMEAITSVYHSYPTKVFQTTFNLLGSHDTPRVLTECNNHVAKSRLLHAILLTFPGSPCIYYGDEIGLTGGIDPGCRKCMVWDESQQNLELRNEIKQLISLRKQEPLLTNSGQFEFIQSLNNEQLVAYRICNEQQAIYVFINPTHQEQTFAPPYEHHNLKVTNVITDQEHAINDNKTYTIAPYDYQIIKIENC